MKIFLDTANINEIDRINSIGLVDGVTTNPTIIAKEGKPFKETIQKISEKVGGPVNAEVTGEFAEEMIAEGRELSKWGKNIVVKIPMNEEGLKAVNVLSKEDIPTNVTLIFSVTQGLLAAKAGATYISPFLGRLEDISVDGLNMIHRLKNVLKEYDFKTEIIAASVRNVQHVERIAECGADIATIPGKLLPKLWKHPLTDKGIETFNNDWEEYEKVNNI